MSEGKAPQVLSHDQVLYARRKRPDLWKKIVVALRRGDIVVGQRRMLYTLRKGRGTDD